MSVMDVYSALREASMSEDQAKVVAASTDLSQVATKADLAELGQQVAFLGHTVSKIEGRLSGLYWFIGAATVILGLVQALPFLITLFQ